METVGKDSIELKDKKKEKKSKTDENVDFPPEKLPKRIDITASSKLDFPIINSESKKLKCLQGEINACVALSHNFVFVGSTDLSIRLWDVTKADWVWSMKGHNAGITSLAIDLKGNRLFSGSLDSTVLVWDTKLDEKVTMNVEKKFVKQLKGHTGKVWSVAFCPQDNSLFSCSEDGTVSKWDLQTGNRQVLERKRTEMPTKLWYSENNGKLFIGCGNFVEVCDVKSFTVIGELIGIEDEVRSISGTSEIVFLGCRDTTIRIYNIKSLELVHILKGHRSSVESLLVANNMLWSGSKNQSVRMWDIGKFECVQTLRGHTGVVTCLTAADMLVFSGSTDWQLRVWDIKPVGTIPEMKHEKGVVCFTASDTGLFTSSGKRTITSWDTTAIRPIKEFKGHVEVVSQLVLHDDKLISGSNDKTVRAWNAKTGECLQIMKNPGQVISLAAMDELIYSGCSDGSISVHDISTGETVQTLQSGNSPVTAIAIACTEKVLRMEYNDIYKHETLTWLFSASGNYIQKWDLKDSVNVPVKAHDDQVNSLAFYKEAVPRSAKQVVHKTKQTVSEKFKNLFINKHDEVEDIDDHSPNFKLWMFSGSADGTIKQWDPMTMECKVTLSGHNESIRSVKIFDDKLFSVSDNSVRVWNTKTLVCEKVIEGLAPKLKFVDISVVDEHLFIATSDTIVRKYNLKLISIPAYLRSVYSLTTLQNLLANKYFASAEADSTPMKQLAELLSFLFHFGLSEPAKELVKKMKISINQKDWTGMSPLYSAILTKRWQLLHQFKEEPDLEDQLEIIEDDHDTMALLRRKGRADDFKFLKGFSGCGVMFPIVDILAHSFYRKDSQLLFLKYWLTRTKDINNRDRDMRSPLHYAVYFGNQTASQLLQDDDRIRVNIVDSRGFTCLHLALLENQNALAGRRGARSENQLRSDRLVCIKNLIATDEEPKKPNLLAVTRGWEKLTPYHLILLQYREDSQNLQTPRKELTEKKEILLAKHQFEQTCELLDYCNSEVKEISTHRTKWAFQHFFRNTIPYVIWLAIGLWVILGQSSAGSASTYNLDQSIRSQFVSDDFTGIASIGDFWSWFDGSFIPTLANLEYHDINQPQDLGGEFLSGHRLVGTVELRQLRQKSQSCKVPSQISPLISECYGKNFEEDKESFGPFVWSEGHPSDKFWGINGQVYPGSGFSFYFDANTNQSLDLSSSLQSNQFLNSSTRLVLISFTIYNGNINLFAVSRLAVEFPAEGTPIAYVGGIHVVKALKYVTSYDRFLLALEIIVLIYFFITFPLAEIREAISERSKYLSEVWNYYEWTVIILFFTVIGMRVQTHNAIKALDFTNTSEFFSDLFPISSTIVVEKYILAFLAIMVLLRLFKYLKMMPLSGPTTQAILETMRNKAFIVYVLLFVFVIISFAITFHLAFGVDIVDVRSMLASLIGLYRAAFGDIDYPSMENSNRVVGPLLFIVFNFFVVIIFMNMFIAVLSEIYIGVQESNTQAWEIYINNVMIDSLISGWHFKWLKHNYWPGQHNHDHGPAHEVHTRRSLVSQSSFQDIKLDMDDSIKKSESIQRKSRADLLSSSSKSSLSKELQELKEELYVEQETAMTENDVFNFALELKSNRSSKSNMDIYNFMNNEVGTLKKDVQELKSMVSQLTLAIQAMNKK